jgi:predicted P-loop ATPase
VTAGMEVSDDNSVSSINFDATRMFYGNAFEAIALRAQERPFHPVRDYLDASKWDGLKRLSTYDEAVSALLLGYG